MSKKPEPTEEALARAYETIAQQASEIESLRETLSLAAMAGVIGSPVPHSRLLEMIVETGARVIGTRAGALYLLDEDRNELTFEVAIGSKAEDASKAEKVKRFRVPLGHGIAGIVAASGQPMAVSDASSDPRLAADIAESIGYYPETVLCVPLVHGARVIGALEMLDKEDGEKFTVADIEALGLFANQAAVALQFSRAHQRVARLLRTRQPDCAQPELELEGDDDDIDSREALQLAELVHEIAWRGEPERKACHALLTGLADYLRGRA